MQDPDRASVKRIGGIKGHCTMCGALEGEYHYDHCPHAKSTRVNPGTDLPPPINIVVRIPASVAPFAGDIQRFMDAMVYKLEKNAHKGRWADRGSIDNLELLRKEVAELEEAIHENNLVKVMLESADVANFALIQAALAMGQKG